MSNIVTLNGITMVINGEETSIDGKGLITATVTYLPKPAEYIRVGDEGPRKGDAHPLDGRLTVEKISMSYKEGEGVLTAHYTGLDESLAEQLQNDDGGSFGDRSPPVYALSYGVQEEPIETHPDFAAIAGTPAAPLNGAVFQRPDTGEEATAGSPAAADAAEFYRFARFEYDSDLVGIESFLDASTATFTESYTTKRRPSSLKGNVGTIDRPDEAPSASGRDWLYMGMSYEERGDVFSVSRTWKLSGPGGWNTTIYS